MPLAVLSPCLLHVDKELTQDKELLHYSRLADLLGKLHRNTNLKFQYYKKAPYEGYKMAKPEYNSLTLNNLVATNVYGMIQKMLCSEYIDLESISPATPPKDFCLPVCDLNDTFCSYINYLRGKDALLFISDNNFGAHRPIEFCTDKPFEINTSTYVDIELTDVLLAHLKPVSNNNEIFPRADFCSNYNCYMKNKIKHDRMCQPEKIALFEQIAEVVAIYNGYKRDRRLTELNSTPQKKRTVYKKEAGKLFYLSIDVESGGFEVFDYRFCHLGQYDFSGNRVKPPSPATHKLIH